MHLRSAGLRILSRKFATGTKQKRKIAESIDPPNNNAYARTQEWNSIDQALAALLPFVDKTAGAKAGFDTSHSFEFQPFAPAPSPNPLGEFIGFNG